MKIAFCLRISTTAARRAAVGFFKHLRDLGAGLGGKRASQKPFDGDPYTRLAIAESADLYMGQACVRFKAHMTSGTLAAGP
jgi:hypothetical protein